MSNNLKKEILDWGIHIVIAVALAILLTVFVARFSIVEGNSMQPTLQNHNVLIVESISTRFRGARQGDIVVLRIPELLTGDEKYAIKRVIATENQHVVISDGKVYVDGIPLEEPYTNQVPTLAGNDLYDDLIVPEGCVYVLGDNRLPDKSRDSRIFGPVNKDRIIGRAVFRIFPFSGIGPVK